MRASSLLLLLGLTGGAHAEICRSPAMDLGAATPPNQNTVFDCGPNLSGTINALAQAGYEIVSLTPIVVSPSPYQTADQLLIQKADAILATGFE